MVATEVGKKWVEKNRRGGSNELTQLTMVRKKQILRLGKQLKRDPYCSAKFKFLV